MDYTKENVIEEIRDYLSFAWDKANDCRGLSAFRSIQHFRNWFYMFGNEDCDELVDEMEDYMYYGKPWLVIISELVDFDWREEDDGCWVNSDADTNGLGKGDIKSIIDEYRSAINFDKIKEFLRGGRRNEKNKI